jgi:hypothetical protein
MPKAKLVLENLPEGIVNVSKMPLGLSATAKTMSVEQAKCLVINYYSLQDYRKAANNQLRSIPAENSQMHGVLQWLAQQTEILEMEIKKALEKWTNEQPIAQWSKSIVGIGPVISAGLLAYLRVYEQRPLLNEKKKMVFDANKQPVLEEIIRHTAGSFLSFSGIAPGVVWLKGEKRPWNADMKLLQWKIGEAFVKTCNNPDNIYGRLYKKEKAIDTRNNYSGKYQNQCIEKLTKYKIKKNTDAYKWYAGCFPAEIWSGWEDLETDDRMARMKEMDMGEGNGLRMLPPAHIHARAKRYAVSIFLSHYHHVCYWLTLNQHPPKPFAFGVLKHPEVDYIPVPNAPWEKVG